ncbi:MAG: aldehyde ferredoxin oxidoreductase family protein [Vallitaleaceae bacterium]|nr:aldehyde ferredoxin oxidoreductase family protein [Vallitaleaceae bacterium]
MSYGYTGNILRINLTTGLIKVEKQSEMFYKKYLGGRNIAAYYMLKEIPEDTDPLGPENKLIAATSILTGTPIPGSARHTLAAKSPLTGGFGDSEAGGFWGPELKFAGYDVLIVEGVSEKPVYIMIKDNQVEILDASHLWGKETGEVESMIREEQKDSRVRILQTGLAGENLVKYAAVTNELKHWNGRCGLGAVMGSKKLRAIAVKGSKKVELYDEAAVLEEAKWFATKMKENEGLKYFSEYGTPAGVAALNGMGLLPTRNFQQGTFEGASEMTGEIMHDELLVKRGACYACPVRCKRVVDFKDDNMTVEGKYGGPEFETMGAFGSACGIKNLKVICKANELCGRYGLDTISTGMTIAWAMECYERGLISNETTGGLMVKFGSTDVLLELIKQIAFKIGFGKILAEGSYRASEIIGNGTKEYSMTTRRQEFAAHEPRGKWNIGLGYALSSTGADHLVVAHDHAFEGMPNESDELGGMDLYPLYTFGIREPLKSTSLEPGKVRLFVHLQALWSLYNVLDVCIFVGVPERRMFSLEQICKLVNNVCGWDMSFWEMIKIGEKGIHLARLFNVRHDNGARWDTLPDRMFEPLEDGPYKGIGINKKDFDNAIRLYYEMMGWNREGVPTKGKLVELDLLNLFN